MEKIKYSIANLFDLNVSKSVTVTGFDEAAQFVPLHTYDPDYFFRKDLLRDVLAWWELAQRGEGLFLTGPTGSGKSSLILQVAARLNWPCHQVTARARMEFADLIGRPIIQSDGSMGFQHGPLYIAYKYGHLFLLDEQDMLDPGESVGFNGIIQGEPLVIPENGGEVVYPHPDFRFVATGNTIGDGDDGLYLGASRQNIAFMDRFWAVFVGYMDPESEKVFLKNATGLDDEKIEKFVALAGETRRLHEKDELEIPFSTRVLIRVAKMTQFFYAVNAEDQHPLHYALDRARLFTTKPETREAVHEIVQRIFGE